MRRTHCTNNLKQIGIGMSNFEVSKKHFPPGEFKPIGVSNSGGLSWCAWFLPYIEESNLFSQINFKFDMRTAPNWKSDLTGPVNTVIPTYLCPSMARHQANRTPEGRLGDFNGNGIYDSGKGEGMGCIDYMGIEGPAAGVINPATGVAYGPYRGVLLDLTSGGPCAGAPQECSSKTISVKNISDGTSHTMLVGECSGKGVADSNGDPAGGEDFTALDGAWASLSNLGKIKLSMAVNGYSAINPPPEINWREEEFFSDHPGGVNILMCDGSVHFLNETTEASVYFALCSRNGEEVIGTNVFAD